MTRSCGSHNNYTTRLPQLLPVSREERTRVYTAKTISGWKILEPGGRSRSRVGGTQCGVRAEPGMTKTAWFRMGGAWENAWGLMWG